MLTQALIQTDVEENWKENQYLRIGDSMFYLPEWSGI